jgi:hypothetical protein
MNAITQRNRLEITLKSYMEFAPYCPRDSYLKLSNEMVRISERLEKIKCMTLSELTKQIPEYLDTKNSIINLF